VEELASLVIAAQTGNLDAFGRIVERHQKMAFAVAYARVNDVHLAEDAAQEAFIEAYLNLGRLVEPAAFPGWFRTIVCRQCNRLTRSKHVATIPLEPVTDISSTTPGPAASVERGEMQQAVHAAIHALPESQRLVTLLFYIAGYSQKEIAALLELPVATVKKRLQYARKQLKERMITMVEDYLEKQPTDGTRFTDKVQLFIAIRIGNITQVKDILTKDPTLVKTQEEKKVTMSHLRIASGWKSAEETLAHVPQARTGTGWSPLRWAIWYGDRTVVEILLDREAMVEAEDWNIAATYGYRDIIALFIERGLTINPQSKGQTPLHTAVSVNQKEVVELLLANGADINARDEADLTPLHWGAAAGHQEIVALLLANSSDINAQDKAGRTPLYWATKNSHTSIMELLSRYDATIWANKAS
jgi:RNA polymerase sigma factor (sigma-70 family)